MIAVWLCYFLFRGRYPDLIPVIRIYAGAGAILGHNFPFYLNFKGGKGIACTAGLVLSYDPLISILGIITFFSIFFATHYVSLGSILVYAGLVTEFIIMGANHWGCFRDASDAGAAEACVVMGLLAVMAFYKHRENIRRLLNGTEKKTYLKNKNPEIKEQSGNGK